MATFPAASAWAEALSRPGSAVVVTDVDRTIVRWSEAATALYGWSADEALGRDVVALLGHPEERGAVEEAVDRTLAGALAIRRWRVRTRAGAVVDIVGFGALVDDGGDPRVVGVVVPADGRPGPVGAVEPATADLLRLVATARLAQVTAEEHRAARDRLRDVAARMAAAPRSADVAAVAVEAAVAATGADAGGLWVARGDEGVATAAALEGFGDEAAAAAAALAVDAPLPVATAIRDLEPVWVADADERKARFPDLDDYGVGGDALAAVPLVVDGTALGVLAVYFARPRRFRSEDRALLSGIGAVAASALSRGLALEASEAVSAVLATALASAPVGFAFFDRELRYVRINDRLAEINGLSEAEHVGRTVRDVVPALSDVAEPLLRQVLTTGQPVLGLELVGETAAHPGDPRVWREDFYPVTDERGDVVGVGAVVLDVTDTRAAAARMAVLGEATAVLTSSLDTHEVLDRLAALAVLHVADACTVVVPGDEGLRRVVLHRRGRGAASAEELAAEPPIPLDGPAPAAVAMRTGRPVLLTDRTEVAAALQRESGLVAVLAVPLATPRATFGVLAMGTVNRVLGPDDVTMATELATRAAVAFENATRFEREHMVAEALQQAVLPDSLPDVPGLSICARYVPAVETAAVGGDWYDVVPLPEGRVAAVVGDIGGHGLRAATAMGQLRNAIHAWLLAGLAPADALRLAESLLGPDGFATVGIVLVDPCTGELTVVSAGHLPPVLADGGKVEVLSGTAPAIGAGVGEVPERRATLAPGGLLVLYTDGLVEVRGRDLMDGLDRLSAAVAGVDREAALDGLCDDLIREVRLAAYDDACVLVLRRDGPGGGTAGRRPV